MMPKTRELVLIVGLACLARFSSSEVHGDPAQPTVGAFGSWRSPITTAMLVQRSVRFGDTCLDGDTLYWIEVRPQEKGRYVIVRRTPNGAVADVLPPPFSARTLVHEYGGAAMTASEGTVYFSNHADQRLWRVVPGTAPEPITAEEKLRFADYVVDRLRNRLIAVCEDHTVSDAEPANRIVSVDLATGEVRMLVEGSDFFSTPRLSPDGRQLAWLSWDHPNMPWDHTKLYTASFNEDGMLSAPRQVAGQKEESIFQPAWSPDGTLYFVSDRTEWWNLYIERDGNVVPVLPMNAEFGVPQWTLGTATYGFEPDGRLVARYTRGGKWELIRIEPASQSHQPVDLSYTTLMSIEVGRGVAYAVAASPTVEATLVEIDLTSGRLTPIRTSLPVPADGYTSVPEPIEFQTDNGRTAHAFYYAPVNRDFRGPEGETPPLLVMIHGGPTSATSAQFRLMIQYWTSRGFAVCDVNYGGSTGYGRDYRNRLRGAWGVVDVADAANAAAFLAKAGKADPRRLIIRGGSAGGYTTLACLAFRKEFRCGASYFGISDLALLAAHTHKFESRYLDKLIGVYPRDEAIYRQRSPIHHLDGFQRPVILLHGLEDEVVPPEQAETIYDSLRKKGVPVAYVPFAGEQHGFRKAENIVRAHEAELYFYSRVLGFDLPEPIEPIEISNLPTPPRHTAVQGANR